tara:strand:+ start:631 stop:735 length:105 start_codon:yes stop_codon:yes gene_type:complete
VTAALIYTGNPLITEYSQDVFTSAGLLGLLIAGC